MRALPAASRVATNVLGLLSLSLMLMSTFCDGVKQVIHSVTPTQGSHAGGTQLTIKGSGFADEGMEGTYQLLRACRG